uniref:J domain-containing protein n=1 Tax=Oryza glaberrima TaxID=4538 RepID=I1R131_ORYGL
MTCACILLPSSASGRRGPPCAHICPPSAVDVFPAYASGRRREPPATDVLPIGTLGRSAVIDELLLAHGVGRREVVRHGDEEGAGDRDRAVGCTLRGRNGEEEAFSAREIVVKKLENRDFVGARKIAIKAQRLFPELENISQLLTVCEVLSSAEAKISGELDWYGVLQVDKMADETVIRKQYNILSYRLHPDNNTLFGAEAAFRFVSEAHAVLSDHAKRSLYDTKRQRASREVAKEATQPPNKTEANINNLAGSMPPSASVLVCWTTSWVARAIARLVPIQNYLFFNMVL